MAHRLQAMGSPNYKNGFEVTLQPHTLNAPLKWRKPQVVFVNSMSDLFQDEVHLKYIKQVFDVMRQASRHQFQVLTKRAERLEQLSKDLPWPENVWMGVSIENQDYLHRIKHLKNTGAKIKFLSLEPLLGPLSNINLKGIDWVIVGGESGPGARPMKESWVTGIQKQCIKYDVPFFFKQWGGVNKKKNGRMLDGEIYDEMPKFEMAPPEQTRLAL